MFISLTGVLGLAPKEGECDGPLDILVAVDGGSHGRYDPLSHALVFA